MKQDLAKVNKYGGGSLKFEDWKGYLLMMEVEEHLKTFKDRLDLVPL